MAKLMGIQYENLTLYGVNREELFNCLNDINRDVYLSPTVNQFTTIYDRACDGPSRKDLADLANLIDFKSKNIIKTQYRYSPHCGCLVCLATYLSAKFLCPALAVYVYDNSILWYHLNQFGEMIDEYITSGDKNWEVGKGLYDLPSNGQIKGGDAIKLCTAFGKEDVVKEVEFILREPDNPPVFRHKMLAKALGIYPALVAGLNYNGVDTGEFVDFWEDFYDEEDYDYYLPSTEEANLMLKKTFILKN